MEYLRGEIPEKDKKPDETGDKDTSKKRRKKSTKVPKSLVFGQPEPAKDEKKRASDKIEEPKQTVKPDKQEAPETTPETTTDHEIELPEVAEELQGELIIDHSNDAEAEIELQPSDSAEILAPSPEVISEGAENTLRGEADVPEPPRVAPPLLFEFLPGIPARPEAVVDPVASEVPHIPPHELHPARDNVAGPSAAANHEQSVDSRAVYRARRRGVSSGVLAGGVAGWWLGKRRGKHVAAEELAPRIEERDKMIEQLVREREQEQKVVKEQASIIERTKHDFDTFMKRIWDRQVLRTPEVPVVPPEQEPAPVLAPMPETVRPVFETIPQAALAEQAPIKPEALRSDIKEQPVENRPVTEELYTVPKDRRVETSAWHRIEVDKTTGKTVEQPAITYGEAFVREQKQEKLARDAAKAQTAAQVGMTVISSGTRETPNPTVPKTDEYSPITPVQPAKPIGQIVRENIPYIKQQLVQRTTSPITWAVSGGVVLIMILAGVL